MENMEKGQPAHRYQLQTLQLLRRPPTPPTWWWPWAPSAAPWKRWWTSSWPRGEKWGVLEVHLYRPFSSRHLLAELPDTLQRLTVLDRTKEPGAFGEPLYLDVTAALNEVDFHEIRVIGGRYGLSSKDTTPADMYAVFQHLAREGHNHFTVGITDDVTHLSIEPCPSSPCLGTPARSL